MWRNFFGAHAEVVGIDLDPDSKKHESFQIKVEIGSQSDSKFLTQVFDKYGPFDVVIDDGSHKQADVVASLEFFKDKMPRNSVYIIEDTHTANISYYRDSERDIFEYLYPWCRELSAQYGRDNPSNFGPMLASINFYDSMVALEFKDTYIRKAIQIGGSTERSITRTLSPGEI
jgi:cephalosporin hydroxylase